MIACFNYALTIDLYIGCFATPGLIHEKILRSYCDWALNEC